MGCPRLPVRLPRLRGHARRAPELNEPEETPRSEEIDYHTLRGSADEFYPVRPQSPALDGTENVEMATDHDGVRTEEVAKQLAHEWLSASSLRAPAAGTEGPLPRIRSN